MAASIWWIRRDLRLNDNPALAAAVKGDRSVIPLFILDDALLSSSRLGQNRLAFLFEGLRQLDSDLRQLGSRLVVRAGDPLDALAALVRNGLAEDIYAEADLSPYSHRRDARVSACLPLTLSGSSSILPPQAVLKSDGAPYTVFTPFSRAWLAAFSGSSGASIPPPANLRFPAGVSGLPIPSITQPAPPLDLFPPGERRALDRLEAFTLGEGAAIYTYAENRNRLDRQGTSMLSPYLRFGMLSPSHAARAAFHAAETAGDASARKAADLPGGIKTWLNELIWRDFYLHILHHFPHVQRNNFRMQGIRWQDDPDLFQAWCDGRTGYPVVDACMRQLLATGWMHNRGRMIVASFLTKDLLIDWRRGEEFFMQHLLDGDPASNNGGWQWTAGTGTDAAPYFRIFNPVLQGMKFDPHGVFIRRWLPELSPLSDQYIHEPWKMPLAAQQHAGVIIGKDYPQPIIDHAWARERTLDAYARAKSS